MRIRTGGRGGTIPGPVTIVSSLGAGNPVSTLVLNDVNPGGTTQEFPGVVFQAGGVTKGSVSFDGFNMNIQTPAGGPAIFFATNGVLCWEFTSTGMFVCNTDNVVDIGQTGAHRPRNIFVATKLQVEANNGLALTNQTNGAGASTGTLTNAPAATNPNFWCPIVINGTVRNFPCW